ncbi:MAG: hypothetical protein LBI11_03560 [Streptococcaceae bacterium]|jgi:ABC-2 type transport system permease protein|nr:hypothetical protein [Streptococcaceae bacterium]
MNRINFQIKTIIKNPFNYIPFVILLLIITIFLFMNAAAADNAGLKAFIKADTTNLKSIVSQQKENLKGQTGKNLKENTAALLENERWLKNDEDVLTAMDNKNWVAAYPLLLEKNKELENSLGENASVDEMKAIHHDILMYQALEERGVNYQEIQTPTSGTTFTLSMIQYIFPIVFVLGIILIMVSFFSEPYTGRINRDILLPGSLSKNLLSTLSTSFCVSIILLMVMTLYSFLLSSSLNGMGSWRYPILTYNLETHQMNFQNLSNIIGPSLVLQMFSLLFLCTFSSLITYILRDRLASLFVSVLFIMGMMFGTRVIVPIQRLAEFLPTTYLMGVSTATGELANSINNFSVSVSNGIIVLALSTFVLFGCRYTLAYKMEK